MLIALISFLMSVDTFNLPETRAQAIKACKVLGFSDVVVVAHEESESGQEIAISFGCIKGE